MVLDYKIKVVDEAVKGQTATGIFLWKHNITPSNPPAICEKVAVQRAAVLLHGLLKKPTLCTFTKSVYKDSQIIQVDIKGPHRSAGRRLHKELLVRLMTWWTLDIIVNVDLTMEKKCNKWTTNERQKASVTHIKALPAKNDQRSGINVIKMITAGL